MMNKLCDPDIMTEDAKKALAKREIKINREELTHKMVQALNNSDFGKYFRIIAWKNLARTNDYNEAVIRFELVRGDV